MADRDVMLSFDEAEDYLSQVADELPPQLLDQLNGGILLLPDVVESPHSLRRGDLYTLGAYHVEPRGLGRYITIHYGSFLEVCAGQSLRRQKKALRDVLLHELTHHLESLAGLRDLEVEDERFLDRYRRDHETD